MSTVTGIGTGSLLGSQVAGSNAAVGKQDFLNLLVTQLSRQDPLNPMDNQQFAAQLAQFSSLELLSNIQGSLEDSLRADATLAGALEGGLAADLIGQRVTVVDNRVELAAGRDAVLRWEAEEPPSRLTARIMNDMGVTVRELVVEDPAAGHAAWDGRDAAGRRLPDGTYTVSYAAQDAAGAEVAARALWEGVVDTVRFREGVPFLVGGGLEFTLAQVSQVSRDGEGGDARATQWAFNW